MRSSSENAMTVQRPMKILFVAMEDSVHTYRWIKMLSGLDAEISLFSCYPRKGAFSRFAREDGIKLFRSDILPGERIILALIVFFHQFFSGESLRSLLRIHKRYGKQKMRELKQELTLQMIIRRFRPDIIHTLHTQTSGYLVSRILPERSQTGPVWVHSVWEAISFFGCALMSIEKK